MKQRSKSNRELEEVGRDGKLIESSQGCVDVGLGSAHRNRPVPWKQSVELDVAELLHAPSVVGDRAFRGIQQEDFPAMEQEIASEQKDRPFDSSR